MGAAPPLLSSRAHSAVGGEAQRVNLDRSNSGRVELGRGAMLNTVRFCIDDKDYTSNPLSMHYPLNVEGCICLNFLLSRFGVIGSVSVEERQNNSQGEVWQVRRVSKQSCPAYGSLQYRSRQPGTGAALLTSQKSRNRWNSFSLTEEKFGPNGWDLAIAIRLFVDVFSFLGGHKRMRGERLSVVAWKCSLKWGNQEPLIRSSDVLLVSARS